MINQTTITRESFRDASMLFLYNIELNGCLLEEEITNKLPRGLGKISFK